MAIEQLQFAPVITPRTLVELARILRERERQDMADIVSGLVPLVETVVDELFRPIGELRAEHEFQPAFDAKSREFEPYRLYINLMLLQTLDASNFLTAYSDAIHRLTMNLFRSAGEKHLPAKRIQTSIEGYFSTLSSLVRSLNATGATQTPQRPEEVNLANWIRASTNLDFALTSLFLILEDAINTPPRPISERLIVAMEESLGDFADQCRILIRASEERLTSAARQTIRSRTPELEWLKSHRNALAEFAGDWIVIEGARLIANRPSYEAARQAALDAGIVRPFITFVPESTEAAFMGI
jgi:hypothetical protein